MDIINLQGIQIGNPFTDSDTFYEIGAGVIIAPSPDVVIEIPANCHLRFNGNPIKATTSITLKGNNTTIEAGLYQIFGSQVTLDGTWIVETGYPEWWGAKASIQKVISSPFDNSAAIQKAFDSPIGHITFACGYYYVGSTLTLGRTKTLSLQGEGQWKPLEAADGIRSSSVLWTDQNINLLELVPISTYDYDGAGHHDSENGNISIHGGVFDVSAVPNFDKSAIFILPNGQKSCRIDTMLIGPINESSPPQYSNPRHSHFLGNAVRIGYKTGVPAEHFFGSRFNLFIYGFGTGFRIDYAEHNNEHQDTPDSVNHGIVTSVQLFGTITWCLLPIYAPSRGFDGGIIGCDISSTRLNHYSTNGGSVAPIIVGNMNEVYLNPYIWDSHYGDPMFEFTNTDHMRFGSRLISLLDRRNIAMGQSERREKVGNDYIFSDSDREIEYQSLTQLATLRGNATGHILGHLDPLQLGSGNAIMQASDYVHLIDNDFLSIEKAMEGITINVESFDGTYDAQNNPNPLIEEISGSPFSPDGFLCKILSFPQDEIIQENTMLKFTIGFHVPGFNAKLQYMALHFSGSGFIHFDNLKVTIIGQNTEMVFFNSPYCNDISTPGLCDVIVPILPTNLDEAIFINSNNLIIELKGIRSGTSWWWSQDPNMQNLFKMSVEGRLNRHFNQLVWTAGGGAMGADITRHGKPYLLGTQQYPTLSSLPSDAAIGARGVAGTGNNLYPVIKTVSGWFVENLVGTTIQLDTCKNTLGRLNVGQQAFNTLLNRAVWWNGTAWV